MTTKATRAERSLAFTRQYKRDHKRCVRDSRLAMAELDLVIESLIRRENLAPRHRDHALAGAWIGHRECHVRPDRLLIYLIDDVELRLVRTGTHAELFKA